MTRSTYLCIGCRVVSRHGYSPGGQANTGSTVCPRCRQPMKAMGTHWRPPKKNDEAAWRRIAKGDYLTERNKRMRERGFATAWRWVKGRRVPEDVRTR